ncbi:MAG: hypothetical protein WD016_05795 [Balneolaceae bacterium]
MTRGKENERGLTASRPSDRWWKRAKEASTTIRREIRQIGKVLDSSGDSAFLIPGTGRFPPGDAHGTHAFANRRVERDKRRCRLTTHV